MDVFLAGAVFLIAYGLIASERFDRTPIALLGEVEAPAVRPGSRAAVREAGLAGDLAARQPAVVEVSADPSGETGGGHRHARLDEQEDGRPTPWRQSSVGVTMHRGALPVVELSALLNLAGDGLLVVTNVVREQS